MHPPDFRLDHLLSDWPDCRLEAHCPKCGQSVFIPIRLLKGEHGDRSFARVLKALKCSRCKVPPGPVYLLAGWHRVACGGAPPGWAIELVKKP